MEGILRLFARPLARLAAALLVLLPIATPAEDGGAPPPVRPALWKVADEDTTIYLFGTVHVLPSGIEWFDGKVASAFESAEELVTEILETDGAPGQTRMLARATLPAGESLRDLMAPEDRARYEEALRELGMPVESFDRYEPWLAAMVLSVAPLAADGFSPSNGVDTMLSGKAKLRNLSHDALETYEYQLELFDSLPLDTQKLYLSQVVKDLPNIREDIDRMIAAWKLGDAEALAALMNSKEAYPGMYELLLTNRNRAWAEWVRQRLEKPGTVFLAVGAGHLAGPGSLQEQLVAHGIAAERVQ